MTKTTKLTYDVFVSHSADDVALAASISNAFRVSGLVPFTDQDVPLTENVADVVWEALADSKALVAILSRPEPSPSMSVEIGAAQAWNKPIYAVVADPATVRLPSSLSNVRVFAPGAVEDIIRDVKRSADELTDDDRRKLQEIYSTTRVPVDRFASDHGQLRQLTERFSKLTGKRVSGERLLSEMLRMRKRGVLPGIRRTAS